MSARAKGRRAIPTLSMAAGTTTDVHLRENCIAPDIAFLVWTTNPKGACARARARVEAAAGSPSSRTRLPFPPPSPERSTTQNILYCIRGETGYSALAGAWPSIKQATKQDTLAAKRIQNATCQRRSTVSPQTPLKRPGTLASGIRNSYNKRSKA